jgi:heme/copper-type cytochrome/quinol oxidase subunit 4
MWSQAVSKKVSHFNIIEKTAFNKPELRNYVIGFSLMVIMLESHAL